MTGIRYYIASNKMGITISTRQRRNQQPIPEPFQVRARNIITSVEQRRQAETRPQSQPQPRPQVQRQEPVIIQRQEPVIIQDNANAPIASRTRSRTRNNAPQQAPAPPVRRQRQIRPSAPMLPEDDDEQLREAIRLSLIEAQPIVSIACRRQVTPSAPLLLEEGDYVEFALTATVVSSDDDGAILQTADNIPIAIAIRYNDEF